MQRPNPEITAPAIAPGTVAFASAIGTTIEWYDFFLYGVVTPLVLNKLFFPNFDAVVGTLLAYTTFFVGFISRPIGGIIFGHFGDRIGRKTVLILTLIIMGTATFLIGLFRNEQDRNEAGKQQQYAHDERGRRKQLACVQNAATRVILG